MTHSHDGILFFCKINEVKPFIGKLMHMDIIIMSERTQIPKDKYQTLIPDMNSVFIYMDAG